MIVQEGIHRLNGSVLQPIEAKENADSLVNQFGKLLGMNLTSLLFEHVEYNNRQNERYTELKVKVSVVDKDAVNEGVGNTYAIDWKDRNVKVSFNSSKDDSLQKLHSMIDTAVSTSYNSLNNTLNNAHSPYKYQCLTVVEEKNKNNEKIQQIKCVIRRNANTQHNQPRGLTITHLYVAAIAVYALSLFYNAK